MLCGTPVIGSGRGGMRELLEKGGQFICDDFNKMESLVSDLLSDRAKLEIAAIKGREFSEQFTLKYFRESWINLISSF
jgi:glycosyltransferase involved in cell wall biosynthesis